MDGDRRWARQMGLASPSLGHKYGAEPVEDVLRWCQRAGIKHVTVFVSSAETCNGAVTPRSPSSRRSSKTSSPIRLAGQRPAGKSISELDCPKATSRSVSAATLPVSMSVWHRGSPPTAWIAVTNPGNASGSGIGNVVGDRSHSGR